MNDRRFLSPVALLAGFLLSACGLVPTVNTAAKSVATAPPTPHHLSGPIPDVTPGYSHWDMSQPVKPPELPCDFASGHLSLHDALQRSTGTAAIATITGTGPARWNTADGKRPTQAYIDALQHPVKVNGRWPVGPGTYTPYTMTVQRPLHGNLGASTTLTAFYKGGAVPYVDAAGKPQQDNVAVCPLGRAPVIGQTYLVWLDADLTTGATDAVRQPMLTVADPYNPATDIVQLPYGPLKLADAL